MKRINALIDSLEHQKYIKKYGKISFSEWYELNKENIEKEMKILSIVKND